MAELKVEFGGKHYTIEVGRDFSLLFKDYDAFVLPMDKQYRLDTAARMLIGVLKDAD